MTTPGTGSRQWTMVDEGWGRKAADFATLSEPGNCREYVAMHHRLGVDAGDRLLDVACGSGLAIELARLRGASGAGIDASARLVAVARDRNPACDIRVGDMNALPWDAASFDVVTSFRGIWGTTPGALAEIHRVLRPGGRAGIKVWGHLKVSPGAWALAPFRLAAAEKVDNQAVMVSLGRPGAGEQLLESYGFLDIERTEVPFAWEFADPQMYARALAASGPAYEAIQNVGEAEFLSSGRAGSGAAAVRLAAQGGNQGRGLSGPQTGRRITRMTGSFLNEPPVSAEVQALFDEDLADGGYVWNGSRLWAHQLGTVKQLFELMSQAFKPSGLSFRQRGILVTAAASALGDSYCSLAWGGKLGGASDAGLAAGVLTGSDAGLSPQEQAIAGWARQVARGVCQIFCARGLFAVRFREFIPNRFLALSDAVLPGLSRGSAEPDFPCRSGADAACPGFPGVLCCCGCLLPDPPGIVWRAIPVCH
jgi:SAM-dependent methyltransferase